MYDRISTYFKAEWKILVLITVSGLIYNLGLLAGPWFEGKMAGCLIDILGGSKVFSDMAVLVLGLNIWTTNDNALYTAGLGLANIFHQKKKPMVLLSGIIGTVLSVWLYYNFTKWLNILNCTLPPVGIILVLSYFMNKKDYEDPKAETQVVNWFAVGGVILGAVVANLVKWGIASINGMVVAAVCYLVGQAVRKKK